MAKFKYAVIQGSQDRSIYYVFFGNLTFRMNAMRHTNRSETKSFQEGVVEADKWLKPKQGKLYHFTTQKVTGKMIYINIDYERPSRKR